MGILGSGQSAEKFDLALKGWATEVGFCCQWIEAWGQKSWNLYGFVRVALTLRLSVVGHCRSNFGLGIRCGESGGGSQILRDTQNLKKMTFPAVSRSLPLTT